MKSRAIVYTLCAMLLVFGLVPGKRTQAMQGTSADPATWSAKRAEQTAAAPVTQEPIGDVTRKNSANYDVFWDLSKEGALIPGLHQDYVPQGLAIDSVRNWLVVSYYRKDGGPGLLSVIDRATGSMVKAVELYKDETTPYSEHAAGVAVSKRHVWIASSHGVYQLKLDDLVQASHMGRVVISDYIRTESLGGFLSISGDTLWVGEFARYDYPTDPSHHLVNRVGQMHSAWASGYKLNADDTLDTSRMDPVTNVVIPDSILSIPDEIQGMAFSGDRVVLSKSYGISSDSDVLVYKLSMDEPADTETDKFGSVRVPIRFLDDLNLTHSVIAPPMSEGIAADGGKLFVLFESGATEYLNSDYPIDRIYETDLAALVAEPPAIRTEPGTLLITEMLLDPSDSASAYRYIELYNDSGHPVDLTGHRINYYWEPKFDKPWEHGVDEFLIHANGSNTDMVVPPFGTKIVWMQTDSSKTVQDFNTHYGTALPDSAFVYTDSGGYSYTGQRFFAIVGPRGDKAYDRYSFVRYNGDAGAGKCRTGVDCDFNKGEAVNYFVPAELDTDSREMERRKPGSLHQTPTPGTLLPGQVPGKPLPPENVEVQPWNGSALLTWSPGPSTLLGYRVYVDDRPVGDSAITVSSDTYQVRVTGLANGKTYKLNVTAVRRGLMPGKTVESLASHDAWATPREVDGLRIEGLPKSGRVGQEYPATVTATYGGTRVFPVRNSLLLWKSGNEAVATVSEEGIVTPHDPGTAIITARYEGISGTVRFNASNGKNEDRDDAEGHDPS